MKKLGPKGSKVLKIFHLILVMLFLGGILASFLLSVRLNLDSFETVGATYQSLKDISYILTRYGAEGTVLVGLIYGIWTGWGFLKYKYVLMKWSGFIVLTLIQRLAVDKLMTANMALLDSEGASVLNNADFIHNHALRNGFLYAQVVLVLVMIGISVAKPFGKKED